MLAKKDEENAALAIYHPWHLYSNTKDTVNKPRKLWSCFFFKKKKSWKSYDKPNRELVNYPVGLEDYGNIISRKGEKEQKKRWLLKETIHY